MEKVSITCTRWFNYLSRDIYGIPLPPPKRSDKKTGEKRLVPNYYEFLPEEFLNNNPNPHYSDHKISVPFRMLMSAPSGSGKVSFTH